MDEPIQNLMKVSSYDYGEANLNKNLSGSAMNKNGVFNLQSSLNMHPQQRRKQRMVSAIPKGQ
jgi:hypothetical protein